MDKREKAEVEKLIHDYIKENLRVEFEVTKELGNIFFNEKTFFRLTLKDEVICLKEITSLREDY